jgi:DNA primase
VIKEVAVRDLAVALQNSNEKVSAVIFDGVVTQRLVEIASEKEVQYLVGAKVGNVAKKSSDIRLLTAKDLGVA